jgi:hypothetical protein
VSLKAMKMDDMDDDHGKWLIHGPQGAGKSRLLSTLAEFGKMAYVDIPGEFGVRAFKGAPWAKNIEVIRPDSVSELDDLYYTLAKGTHDYVSLGLDSLTATQRLTNRFVLGQTESSVREITRSGDKTDFKTWGQSLNIMSDIAVYWFGLANSFRAKPIHVGMTAQTKFNDGEGGEASMLMPDVQKGARSIVMAVPDYVLYCDREIGDDGTVNRIVRIGQTPGIAIKARIPWTLQDKIPDVLGRKEPLSLAKLSTVLGVGGAS